MDELAVPSLAGELAAPAAAAANPAYVLSARAPEQPAPFNVHAPFYWIGERFFGSVSSSILTFLALWLLILAHPIEFIQYLTTSAVFVSADGVPCRISGTGACWAFIEKNLPFFTYTFYPQGERWRIDLMLALGAMLVGWLLWPNAPRKGLGSLLFFVVYPVLAFVLAYGLPAIGLTRVPTNLWGGVFVSLMCAALGIVFSLPAGILLALGRRSHMPFVKALSVAYIEVVRGVPFITVLFLANTMLPLFVPDYLTPDTLARPFIATALFSAAYMAEIVRGGLQAMPKGQYEGAMAMGLGYWQIMRLIILPQALTIVIPGIVSTFIGLFKDTTLIASIGAFDFLKAVETRRIDPAWAGPSISATGYIFAAAFYFVFCYGMARYSLMMERKLAAGRRR